MYYRSYYISDFLHFYNMTNFMHMNLLAIINPLFDLVRLHSILISEGIKGLTNLSHKSTSKLIEENLSTNKIV